jgi:hypothetical protein
MRTITINGKTLKVSTAEQRALETLQASDYVAKKSQFVEGQYHRYQTYIFATHSPEALEVLGITIKRYIDWRIPLSEGRGLSRKEHAFFVEHPQCDFVVSGNKRRINLILRKLGQEDGYVVKVH